MKGLQVAWGDGSLSRPTQALIFLPTDISLPRRRRKYVKLRGYVDYDISDVHVPAWRTGDLAVRSPLSSSTLLSTKSLSLWCEQNVQYKSVQQFENHMVTAVVNNTEFPRK